MPSKQAQSLGSQMVKKLAEREALLKGMSVIYEG
jgi:hypothetical protein